MSIALFRYFGVLNTVESGQGTVGRELGGRELETGTWGRELGQGTGDRERGAANWGQGTWDRELGSVPAGPQPPAPDDGFPRWQCSPPDLNRQLQRAAFPAGPQLAVFCAGP